AARSDRSCRAGGAPRALEPTRQLARHRRARPPALGSSGARRVERIPLARGGPAAPEGAHAPARPAARPQTDRLSEGERVLPPLRVTGARGAGPAALARDRGSQAVGPRGAPLAG